MVEPTERIGPCELYLGDCRDVLPVLSGIDAVVTDPPFGISDSAFTTPERKGKRTGGVNGYHPPSDWDHTIDPEWCRLCCEASGRVAWFGHWRKRPEVESAMTHPLRAEIVWAKDCHVGPPCPVAMRDERIWLFSESGITGQRFETSVWDEPIIPTWSHRHHKNEKPLRLMTRLVRFFTASGEVVCDPFMGSGTTALACLRLGDRRFIGIEKDPQHFATAVKRIREAVQADRDSLFPAFPQGAA